VDDTFLLMKRYICMIDNPAKIAYIESATGGGGSGLRPGIASSADPGSVLQGRVIFFADYSPQFIIRP
jgi:hypothetical protein